MSNKTNKLIPELRFPEFEALWKIITLSEVCDVFRGGTFSKADMDENGTEPCIHYGELFTKYNEVISYIFSKTNKSDGFRSQAGDILMPSSDVTPNGLAKASAIIIDDVVLGGDMNIIRPKTDINSIFLSYLLNHSKSEIIKLVSGTTVKHIYPSQIINCQIPIINCQKEQQKIASCLSSLDEVIAAHSQKLDTLKDHKKGLMQNLFPQEGETVPNYRFPEFLKDGDWVEKSLDSHCLNLSSGKDKNTPDGNYALYGSTGIIGKASDASYDGDFILVARVGANAGLLNRAKGKFSVTDNTLVIDLKKEEVIDFVQYSLENIGLNKLVFGSGQPLITGGQLKSLNLIIPSKPQEQQKIASCLTALDNLITAQAEKIEQLKLHKKGLMQGLFPKLSEL
jgi:type I restriction enzyme S subunit